MSGAPQRKDAMRGLSAVFLLAIIVISVVGYVVGINDGVPSFDQETGVDSLLAEQPEHREHPDQHETSQAPTSADPTTMPAVSYAEMRRRESGPTGHWKSTLASIPQPEYDLFAELVPSDSDKQRSSLIRAERRAFNGAPPIIPHAIENTSDAACYACHGRGMRIENRVANQMSHGFLANCTQCHASPPPQPFQRWDSKVENSFTGLPAPMRGERAFVGAPPTIPHSTWMRENCLSCHGHRAGWAGLESTHPWRTQCQQCHAPSAELEQAIVPAQIGFLAPIDVTTE